MGAQAQPRPAISVGEIRCFSYSTGKFLSRNLNLLPLAKMFIKPASLQDLSSHQRCTVISGFHPGRSFRQFGLPLWFGDLRVVCLEWLVD